MTITVILVATVLVVEVASWFIWRNALERLYGYWVLWRVRRFLTRKDISLGD